MRLTFYPVILIVIFLISSCKDKNSNTQGFTENEYFYISSEYPSIIKSMMVNKGDKVKIDMPLLKLDSEALLNQRDNLIKNKEYEESILKNIEKGIRQSEIDIIEIDIRRLSNESKKMNSILERKQTLHKKGFLSIDELENEKLKVQKINYELKSKEAELANKVLPAREDEINAQRIRIENIGIQIERVNIDIAKSTLKSPINGMVHDILRKKGEAVVAASPIIVIIPEDEIKIIFYLNRTQLYKTKLGDTILVKIHDIKKEYEAKVNYISPAPEYTPPMLYDSRNDNLVYLVEARIKEKGVNLLAGIPVEIILQ
ncbi:HlyD family secretion protein [Rosenbergiella australiborealis]|uniref:HlyD family secretion protein n=1 Tax=Rosenbergiella australiborealis TaxID=1544696 RepID=UPI001F4EBF48|nr:HlyD family efflux transporter periplasmic adaptor subunit [Rosenbergiella australiborealis]